MADAVFPDTTVLCNFAAVHRLDLLEGWLRGRGRWVEAVAVEVRRSGQVHPDLLSIAQRGWLREPVEVPGHLVPVVEQRRRSALGGLASQPMKHLGEAQSIVLIEEIDELRGSWWITDDADAFEYAQARRIRTYRTIDVMRFVVADGDLTPDRAYQLMGAMREADRHLVMPTTSADLW